MPFPLPLLLPLPLPTDEPGASSSPVTYHWSPSSDPALFPGRQAGVFAGEQQVGVFGIVHPEVGRGGLCHGRDQSLVVG